MSEQGNDSLTERPLRILSLGAGVQSTTVLLMMLNGDLQRADHVIFADTGWEPAAVYQHLNYLQELMRQAEMPFHIVSAGNLRDDTLDVTKRSASLPLFMRDANGKKGMIRRQCTAEYKIEPLIAKQRELVGLRKGQRCKEHLATTVIGISIDESQRMRDAAFSWLRNEYPLVDLNMTRQDCINYCTARGYKKPPRSACIGCPFKSDDEWRRLRNDTPDEWQDAVAFDHALRTHRKMTSAQLSSTPYLHRSLVPLDQVDLRTQKELGQHSLFDQECEGMCGV